MVRTQFVGSGATTSTESGLFEVTIALEGTKKVVLPTPDGSVLHSGKCEPIQLHGFAGSELGATACFKIHDGFFYALTNCDAFGVIEVDYTSYYHCIRFPVDDPQASTCQAARRIFRRQHADGPVNGRWHSLSLEVDERNNELLIVEGRAEWQGGKGSLQRGTYYHKIDVEDEEVEVLQERRSRIGPANDPFSPDPETKNGLTPDLPSRHKHMDAWNPLASGLAPQMLADSKLSRSKYRGYDVTCIERDDFRYSPVSFWPQQNKRLHQVLNLPAELQRHSNVEFRAWKDKRCIVYLVSSGGIGKVKCLNFDAYAPVSRFESSAYAQLQIRGRLPRLQSDAEHLRDISPAPEPFELAVFDLHEV
ncbi:hypothetical protein K458DRAFT_410650 [Lentithecium fluviatile CBS 122367]|uniref:Uncharacterized protein n=1 Tax=Lentithecium fluviatile CBS 122367 TaxID=1168545 RepID=A0A6G1IDX1_9PLEO|nr:hypothetical protein K458DRAFT_410650 [Lentithecium fluviatile CBS 122367]